MLRSWASGRCFSGRFFFNYANLQPIRRHIIHYIFSLSGHRLTWKAYHNFNDIVGYLDYLAKTYPDLCSVQTIGTTHEGRALKLLKLVVLHSTFSSWRYTPEFQLNFLIEFQTVIRRMKPFGLMVEYMLVNGLVLPSPLISSIILSKIGRSCPAT